MYNTIQIVIVEDDTDLLNGLCKALKDDTRKIFACEDLKSARNQIFLSNPALVILDINLPDGSGLDLVKEIRERNLKISIILLSANDTDVDVVKGLEMGADDYVTKPFSLSVLRARVNTCLRKNAPTSQGDVIKTGKYSFDFEKMIFMVDESEV